MLFLMVFWSCGCLVLAAQASQSNTQASGQRIEVANIPVGLCGVGRSTKRAVTLVLMPEHFAESAHVRSGGLQFDDSDVAAPSWPDRPDQVEAPRIGRIACVGRGVEPQLGRGC